MPFAFGPKGIEKHEFPSTSTLLKPLDPGLGARRGTARWIAFALLLAVILVGLANLSALGPAKPPFPMNQDPARLATASLGVAIDAATPPPASGGVSRGPGLGGPKRLQIRNLDAASGPAKAAGEQQSVSVLRAPRQSAIRVPQVLPQRKAAFAVLPVRQCWSRGAEMTVEERATATLRAGFVVVGSFVDPMNALNRYAEIKDNWQAAIVQSEVSGRVFRRVILGPFDRETAEAAQRSIVAEGNPDAWTLAANCSPDLQIKPR